jgi:DNA repair exonuclease SbcCD ATPase subunit
MKTPYPRLATIALSGLLFATTGAQAQENEGRIPDRARHAERQPDREAPEAERIRRMIGELKQLQAAGKPEEARKLARQLQRISKSNPQLRERIQRAISERKAGPDRRDVPPPHARIQHLRQAAEHLQAAGYTDHAEKARAEIGRLEAEAKRHEADQPRPDMNPLMEELRKLRREMEELRGEVRRLKAEAPKRIERPMPPPGDVQ